MKEKDADHLSRFPLSEISVQTAPKLRKFLSVKNFCELPVTKTMNITFFRG